MLVCSRYEKGRWQDPPMSSRCATKFGLQERRGTNRQPNGRCQQCELNGGADPEVAGAAVDAAAQGLMFPQAEPPSELLHLHCMAWDDLIVVPQGILRVRSV